MTLVGVAAVYLALGALSGMFAGLFGIGGGLIIVPGLIFSFGLQGVSADVAAHLAVGTSLATIVFTSVSSIHAHNQHGAVQWHLFRSMGLGIVFGAVLGAWTAAQLSGQALETAIGIFVLVMAAKMLIGGSPKPGRHTPGPAGSMAAGGFIGWLSSIFGIGGGTLTVPYLSWCNVRMQYAVATSAAIGLPIALAGAGANVWTGWQHPLLPDYSVGFVHLPALAGVVATSVVCARLGAKLAHKLDAKFLKRIFAIFLIVVGLRFLIS
ncbi:MAG: sulfite exporter TauE/SafE family protein [Pseudomonadota bacterium]|nr:sulfite exporter TauE/SafE family protein [Pseudomonadota bacterium]